MIKIEKEPDGNPTPCTTFWTGNLQKNKGENNPRAVNLGGLFSLVQISEQRQQEHAKHNHFRQRKLHEHHLRSGGDTSPPKSVAHEHYTKGDLENTRIGTNSPRNDSEPKDLFRIHGVRTPIYRQTK